MFGNHQQNPVTTTADFPELEQLDQVATAGSCCSPKTTTAPTTSAMSVGQDQGDVAECQVMAGTPVDKAQAEAGGLYRDHDGQRYWFCCAACGPMFNADPDEYAAA